MFCKLPTVINTQAAHLQVSKMTTKTAFFSQPFLQSFDGIIFTIATTYCQLTNHLKILQTILQYISWQIINSWAIDTNLVFTCKETIMLLSSVMAKTNRGPVSV